MVRFAATPAPAARRGATARRWSHVETVALLRAVEPWSGPGQRGVVTVHDRHVEVRPGDGQDLHAALVHCGRLVAALDLTLRAAGWVPRVHVDEDASPPRLTVTAEGRRPASGRDLARRRAEHRWHSAPEGPPGRVDGRALARIAAAAETGGARLCLLNGRSRDGTTAWCPPGEVPEESWGHDLPWSRDPVLAACARGSRARSVVVAGVVAHAAGVEAVRHAHRADLHPLSTALPAPTVACRVLGRAGADDGEPWLVHALVHVRG